MSVENLILLLEETPTISIYKIRKWHTYILIDERSDYEDIEKITRSSSYGSQRFFQGEVSVENTVFFA